MKLFIPSNSQGFIMPFLMFSIVFIMSLVTVIATSTLNTYNLANRETYRISAQLAADAGLDRGLRELNFDDTWTGTGSEVTLLDSENMRTTYETTVLNGATDDEKTMKVIARTYFPSATTTPKVQRKYEVDLRAVTSGANFASVVTGTGGLILNGNAKISGGDVIANGFITMSNNSQIGTQTNSVNVRVAHQKCPNPPDASYPQICGSGNGQPITMGLTAKIYATVYARNQTDGTNMFNPGLVVGQNPAPSSLSSYDRTTHPVSVTKNATDADISCPNNGSVTWPANVKILGNMTISNNCKVTISGNTWITGKLHLGNNSQIIISDILGLTRPVVMIDGSEGFNFGINSKIIPNTNNTGAELRTFWSHSTSGCSPDCTAVTGAPLANSQNITTIELNNNGEAPYSIFIAQWSRVRVSNNGSLGAVAGQSIELGNNAIINFTTSVPGSDNLTKTYVKRGYMRVFN